MSRMVKDFIEISDYASLDQLIEKLTEVRESLPEGADAELKLQGCDVFGRKLSIAYFRPQTEEEEACDARYANAYRASRERELARLQEELGVVCRPPKGGSQLRAVA
jgi:hypothetical protein